MDKYRHLEKKDKPKHIDYAILVIVIMFALFGIIMVFDSSIKLLSNKYHFVILQTIWVGLGFVGLWFCTIYSYKKLAKLSLVFLIIDLVCLILVLFIGQKINGAIRWINIGPLQFQPSELMKPIIILYLAAWFAKPKKTFDSFKKQLQYTFTSELIPLLSLLFLILLLILIGRDLGTAIIIAIIALSMYFLQGEGFASLLSLFLAAIPIGISAIFAIVIEPYRFARLLNFAGLSKDPLKNGYQISQILIAIGSGGLFGKGFTQSIQKQRYLVETTAATDSIFAVIAEEFGFIGSLILFSGYLFLFYKCIFLAVHTQDKQGRLIILGITIWILAQAMLNIAVNVNLVPLTGVPLPFISYGGSSTIIMLSSIGIMLNISKSHEEKS